LEVTHAAFSPVSRNVGRIDEHDRGKGRRQIRLPEGVAMIKAELKKKHPEPVLVTLRSALGDAELEEAEGDWSDCMKYIKTARAALGK
jgi:hypothetical protein